MEAGLRRGPVLSRRARVAVICSGHGMSRTVIEMLADELVDVVAVVIERSKSALASDQDLLRTCDSLGIPITMVDGADSPQAVTAMTELAPDLLLVIDCRRPISPALLAASSFGGVGLHPSLLPDYPGPDAINWAILRGETTTGVTMFLLDGQAGARDNRRAGGHDRSDAIVARRSVRIGPNDTCAELYVRTGEAGAELLVEQLPAMLSGLALRATQPLDRGVVHLPARTPAMGVIDWAATGRAVHDWVRALTVPCSGAFTKLGGNKVMVWATRLPSPREPIGPPGEVIGFDRGGVRVGVRGGSIVVSRMSHAGTPPAPAALWCRVSGVEIGARFELVSADRAAWARGTGMAPGRTARSVS